MKKIVLFTILLTASLLAKDYALIVGISKYKNMENLSHINKDILIYKKILKNKDVSSRDIKILKDKKATKKSIINYLESVFNTIPHNKNNRFFMFFSGHGKSTNSKDLKNNPNTNKYLKKSGVILPYDYDKNNLANTVIIGKKDLKPYLTKIDKYVKESFIIFDACYAGNSIKGKLRKRTPFIYSNPKDYPYNNIVYIASSTPKKKAKSGVLSKVLDSCFKKNRNLIKLKICMNNKLKSTGQRAVVLFK